MNTLSSLLKIMNKTIYKQTDFRWGSKPYPIKKSSFAGNGCGCVACTHLIIENAKVSDDKTWNGVGLTTTQTNTVTLYYIPAKASTTLSGDAVWFKATTTPTNHAITKWDGNSYLYSTTPSASDNSTKVATTAYVDNAVGSVQTTSVQIVRW